MNIQGANRLKDDVQRAGRASDASSGTVAASIAGARRSAAVDSPPSADIPVAVRQASVEQVKRAAEAINRALRQSNRNLEFRLDEQTNRVVVKLTDTETGELIRQIPSDEMLAISRAIGEFQQGLLLRQKA